MNKTWELIKRNASRERLVASGLALAIGVSATHGAQARSAEPRQATANTPALAGVPRLSIDVEPVKGSSRQFRVDYSSTQPGLYEIELHPQQDGEDIEVKAIPPLPEGELNPGYKDTPDRAISAKEADKARRLYDLVNEGLSDPWITSGEYRTGYELRGPGVIYKIYESVLLERNKRHSHLKVAAPNNAKEFELEATISAADESASDTDSAKIVNKRTKV